MWYQAAPAMIQASHGRHLRAIPSRQPLRIRLGWRLAADMNKNGQSVEDASNLALGTTNWFSPNFNVFTETTPSPAATI